MGRLDSLVLGGGGVLEAGERVGFGGLRQPSG